MTDRERLEEELDAAYQDIEELHEIIMKYETDMTFSHEMSYEDLLSEHNNATNYAMYLDSCVCDYE